MIFHRNVMDRSCFFLFERFLCRGPMNHDLFSKSSTKSTVELLDRGVFFHFSNIGNQIITDPMDQFVDLSIKIHNIAFSLSIVKKVIEGKNGSRFFKRELFAIYAGFR